MNFSKPTLLTDESRRYSHQRFVAVRRVGKEWVIHFVYDGMKLEKTERSKAGISSPKMPAKRVLTMTVSVGEEIFQSFGGLKIQSVRDVLIAKAL